MELYTDLNEISLARFIDVYNGNYLPLIKDGKPSDEELINAAESLISEYITIVGGSSVLAEINRKNEELNLICTIKALEACENLVKIRKWVDASEVLSELGYKLSPDDHTAIESKIKSVLAVKRMRLDLIKKEITDVDKKPDPDYFIREIALVMTHFKMVINENDISAKKYAYMIKRMCDEVKASEMIARKMKGKR